LTPAQARAYFADRLELEASLHRSVAHAARARAALLEQPKSENYRRAAKAYAKRLEEAAALLEQPLEVPEGEQS
jgi:hypothetical protein